MIYNELNNIEKIFIDKDPNNNNNSNHSNN
jgi:hypothetical protein